MEQPEASLQRADSAATLAITGLHDIEESILSPKWGMTGRSDASVHVTIKKQTAGVETSASAKSANLDRAESGPKPLEIKAGSNWAMAEHEAQTRLYALMMEERYRKSLLSLAIAASLTSLHSRHSDQIRLAILHPDRFNASGSRWTSRNPNLAHAEESTGPIHCPSKSYARAPCIGSRMRRQSSGSHCCCGQPRYRSRQSKEPPLCTCERISRRRRSRLRIFWYSSCYHRHSYCRSSSGTPPSFAFNDR